MILDVKTKWMTGIETKSATLSAMPVTYRQACAFVEKLHRHHKPPAGHKFSIGVANNDGALVGVAMCGRPLARHWDDGFTLEVIRTCTDGTANANSFLYAACWKAGKAMGYQRLITYTQEGESGSSLRGAGWKIIGTRKPRANWHFSTTNNLQNMRDPDVKGWIQRTVWEIS